MRTCLSKATHAVVGFEGADANYASGVLYWHDNEFDAWVEAKRINNIPDGICYVVSAPKGKLPQDTEQAIRELIINFFGCEEVNE